METIVIDTINELPKVAEKIIEMLGDRRIVAFYGDMGAGKTTLIREIASQFGVRDTVTSPTFALVNQYLTATEARIYHFDFYRINRIEEAYDLGYEEYFFSGDLCLIEWPEKISELLPSSALKVRILTHPDAYDARTIIIG